MTKIAEYKIIGSSKEHDTLKTALITGRRHLAGGAGSFALKVQTDRVRDYMAHITDVNNDITMAEGTSAINTSTVKIDLTREMLTEHAS